MTKERKAELIRILKFTLFSASAGLIQIGVYSHIRIFVKFPEESWQDYVVANIPSLILSVVWNFTFNRKFTFKSANNVKIAMLLTLAFYAVFTPASILLGALVVDKVATAWVGDVVFVVTLLLNFVLEFIHQRFIVYRKSVDTAVKKEPEKTE